MCFPDIFHDVLIGRKWVPAEFDELLLFLRVFFTQIEINGPCTRYAGISYKREGPLNYLSPFEKCTQMNRVNPITLAITRSSSSF